MKTDMAAYMKKRRLERRTTLIEMAGGKCVRCGSTNDLQFDHIDRSTKSFILSGCYLDRSWSRILEELAKCQLLCASCHKEKTREFKDHGESTRKILDCGTEAMYAKGCRCNPCRQARYDAKVRRGELNGNRKVRYI